MSGLKERWKAFVSDWYILPVALFFALLIWSLYTISLGQETYAQYSVTVITSIPGFEENSVAQEALVARGNVAGYYALRQKLNRNKSVPVTINVDESFFVPVQGEKGVFSLNTDYIADEISTALKGGFTPDSFETEYLTFKFEQQQYRMVAVEARGSISCKSQYMITSGIEIVPDSVRVYGNESLLKNVKSVLTNHIIASNVRNSASGRIGLQPIKGLRFESDNVQYSYTVSRYIESTKVVEIVIINVPNDKNMIVLPKQLELTYRRPFDRKGPNLDIDPIVTVDYFDYVNSLTGKVVPTVHNSNSEIFQYTMNPQYVECIITDK